MSAGRLFSFALSASALVAASRNNATAPQPGNRPVSLPAAQGSFPNASIPLLDASCQFQTQQLTQSYYPPDADCIEFKIPVSITTDVNTFNIPSWTDDHQLQDFLNLATTREGGGVPSSIVGTRQVVQTVHIAASFCTPKVNAKRTIILATHGIGQARTHWNSEYQPERFNFVQHAISRGYSVWFYDRLGQGESSKISGFQNQMRNQKTILTQLARAVKSGQFTGSFGAPSKLALMGYSFGSFMTHFAIADTPDLADAVILTAINYNTTGINTNGLARSFVPRIASLQNPRLFGKHDPGYLTWVDSIAQVNTYFKFPFYDAPTISYCEENKQPFAIAEFLTIADGEFDASRFTGAALAITGKPDYIICDGNCEGLFEEPARTLFSGASSFVPFLQPNAGHNINFHANALDAYNVITGFLEQNGL